MTFKDKHALRQAFARRIRMRRAELDISQEELASRAGLAQTYLSDVERAKRNVSIDNIQKIASALKLDKAGIFEEQK